MVASIARSSSVTAVLELVCFTVAPPSPGAIPLCNNQVARWQCLLRHSRNAQVRALALIALDQLGFPSLERFRAGNSSRSRMHLPADGLPASRGHCTPPTMVFGKRLSVVRVRARAAVIRRSQGQLPALRAEVELPT